MNTYDEMKNFVENSNGILITKEFNEVGISKYYINKLIEDGIIERYQKGVYVRFDTFEDKYYILQKKNPSIIYSFNTAMYFHQMTERTPEYMDITVYRGYKLESSKDIRIHYVNKKNICLGVIELETTQGFKVNTYDLERITCDLIKCRNTGVDKEQINKFIRKMFLEKQLNTVKLIDYAKKLKCEKKIRNVMEVFL